MPKLRTLSGQDLLRIFAGFGFHPVSQRGSHVKLRRIVPGGTRQTLTVALHDEVDKLSASSSVHRRSGVAASLLHSGVKPEISSDRPIGNATTGGQDTAHLGVDTGR